MWRLRYLLLTSKCTFMSWLLHSLDLPGRGKDTHRLMSRVDYGFNQWLVVSFVMKKFYVYLFTDGETVYILLYSCTSCKYIFTFYGLKINLQILSYFWIFCWPYTQRELYTKAKFLEDSKSQDKAQFKNRRHISSNLLYFNFTKSRWKTLETMNILNLRRNKADIALASYVMKSLKSTCL